MGEKYYEKNIRRFSFDKGKDKFLAHVFILENTKEFIRENEVPFCVDFYEIFFITQGEGYLLLDFEKIPVKKGMVFCLPPAKIRQWDVKDPVNGYALIFEEEFFSSFFNDDLFIYRFNIFNNTVTPSGFILKEETFESMLNHIKELIVERSSIDIDSPHLFRATYYLLLIKINREYVRMFDLETELFSNSFLVQFRKKLTENICTMHNVQDYAELLGISRIQLNKLSKRYFGKTANTFVREHLAAKAKSELLYSNKSVSEIAYALNFSDNSNFHRFFLRMTGLKPTEFKALFSK